MRADVGKYSKILVASGAMVFGVICVGAVFGTLNGESVYSIDQENYQRLDFTFEPTIQITLSSSTLLVSDLVVNTYSDSNTIDIFAGTNVAAGMQLTATVGSAGNPTSDLVQTGTANVFESIATNANLANLGESQSANIWGYSYKDSSTETWGSYNGLPVYGNTGAVLLDTNNAASNTINFKIAAKAGGAQAMGNYTNSINFSAVAKVVTTNYAINFLNGGNDVTNWPTNISSSDTTGNGAVIALSSLVPTKDGYTFAGWCTVSTNDGSCAGNIYQPGENYPISAVGNTVIVNLYAMWQALPVTTFDDAYAAAGKAKYGSTNYYAMQDMTSDICSSVTKGQVGTLIDTRGANKQTYTVAKLKDGKCWMTENLNLAGGTALSANDTDFESTYTLPTTNGWSVSDDKLVLPSSNASGFSSDNYSYVYNSGNITTNQSDCTSSQPCNSYYSWDAATLGSGRSISTDNQNAPYSICPKNWKLPSTFNGTDESTDFRALMIAFGGSKTVQTYNSSTSPKGSAMYSTLRSAPNNFLLAGLYRNSSFYDGGSGGYYWSSTSYSSGTLARYLYFDSSFVLSASYYDRRYGFSVRCLAKGASIEDLTYMQDFATLSSDTKAKIVNNMETERTYTLKDKRDEQEYTVAKLRDGKVWMTENLNIAGGTALSADDTDVASTYISSFSTSNNLTKTGNTIVLPSSSTSGFSSDNYSYVYNSPNKTNCGALNQNVQCYSYYSWDAATLGSGRSISTDNTDAPYSICPKNWKLPTSRTTSATNWQTTSDFYMLAHQYGLDSTTSTSESDADFYNQAGPVNNSIPNFLLAGLYSNSSFADGGSRGAYWSSTSSSSITYARTLYFYSSRVGSADYGNRRYGFSVRCLLNSGS